MDKPFTYLKNASFNDVLSIVVTADAGSCPIHYELDEGAQRAWLLRQLQTDHHFRFIECFEFRQNDGGEWGFRGWGEDEGIPYNDCPLHLLSQSSGAISHPWRQKVYECQSRQPAIPQGAWLHSVTAITLPDGRTETEFLYRGDKTFECSAGKAWQLPRNVVRRLLRDGDGIAYGRA